MSTTTTSDTLPLDPSTLPGPETIATRTLTNGLRLLAWENFVSPAVYVTASFAVGSHDESPAQKGLNNLVAALLSRGTRHHDYDTINEMIESRSASLAFAGSVLSTSLSIKSLAEDMPDLLRLAAEMLREPTFPEDQFARIKDRVLTALREREHDPRSMASLAFYKLAYPETHAYHWPISGYIETVEPFTRADAEAFFATHYEPRDGIIVISGAMPAAEALDLLEEIFGDWENTPSRQRLPLPNKHPLPEHAVEHFTEVPGKAQSDFVLGVPALSANDTDYVPAQVANSILGVFGLMGRLGERVRDEKGLAYYAYSSLGRAKTPIKAPWIAIAGVAPENVTLAVETTLAEIRRMAEEPVPEEELTDNKLYLIGTLPLQLETNEGMAGTIKNMVYYDLGLDYLQRLPERIWQVEAADVQRVVQTYLAHGRHVLSVAGPRTASE
nr:pitrilysin family protein [Ardenticatena sp.]